jgi:SagB-type dehydrogenase family enzyme
MAFEYSSASAFAAMPNLEAWETYHENSKTGRYDAYPKNETVLARMREIPESLSYDSFPVVALPTSRVPFTLSLEEAMVARATARRMESCKISLEHISALFGLAYGITRDLREQGYPRTFRTVPSGGGLYPLEIYFHTRAAEGLDAGTYHFSPDSNLLHQIRRGDDTDTIAKALVQQNLATQSALQYFLTAVFERSYFKYGERSYRFILIEAGHVAQNINLVATACGLGCVNIGGFFDREVDSFLGLDGIAHSTIYMGAIGRSLSEVGGTRPSLA